MIEKILERLDTEYTIEVLKEMIRIPSVVGDEEAYADYLFIIP